MDLAGLLADLSERSRVLAARRPLPLETARSLAEALRVERTYASNAMEGNSLTLQETRVALEGLTVGGKPLRDHLEAVDGAEAFDHVEGLAQRRPPLSEHALRSVHALVLRRSRPDDAGRYRDVQVFVTGSRHVPPPPAMVPSRMHELMGWLQRAGKDEATHPVARAAEFHARLVAGHPFVDGNGRTAGLVSNPLLVQDGYPPPHGHR